MRQTPRRSRGLAGALGAATGAALGLLGLWSALAGPFTPRGTQPPLAFEILQPGDCAGCHANYDATNHVEPWDTWAGSMMANAARDPIFWAALDVANNDVPGIGDFCLRCHVPTGWLGGRAFPPGGTSDGCSLVGVIDESDNDFAGVSCHLCHRMHVNPAPPPGEDPVYFENADFWIDDVVCDGPGDFEPCRRGPYDYQGAGEVPPPHAWKYSDYHVSNDICGNCHNVTNPLHELIDENGNPTGILFPIERTFKEWQQSDYADSGGGSFQTCSNCHMPDATEDPVYACLQQDNNRTGDMPVHWMAGGNTWIPAVLRDEYPTLNRDDSFDATIARATELLQSQSATLDLTVPAAAPPGGLLAVDVRVTNLSGHKLPTGYSEGRRMWLHLEARDALDQVFWESGAYDAATGDLTVDPQLKLYEAQQGEWSASAGECEIEDALGNPQFHFALNDCIRLDNRIPPLGFTGGADLETRPVSYVYPETSPGSGVLVHWDDTTYRVPIPADVASPVTVNATLRYQTASKEYVEFLRDEAVNNGFPDDCIGRTTGLPTESRGEILHNLWLQHDRSPPVDMVTGSGSSVVEAAIFADGFESGDTSAWSGAVP